ncbi:MAG: electron transport complex subunit E [Clostridia bacterium]|nr:electron transport complex subunit E [Clostridia bacterium]
MSLGKEFTKGIIKENPIFIMLLGMCPVLAVSSSVINGLGMGVAATAVLVASNIAVSALRKIIPDSIRIPCFIVIIASFVTIVDLSVKAYSPALSQSLGIFIPLIVVNCIILGRAEAFASKNGVLGSILDALGMGIGFTLSLVVLSAVREVLGAGEFLGNSLFGAGFQPALIMILPPGAFLALGCLLGLINLKQQKSSQAERS